MNLSDATVGQLMIPVGGVPPPGQAAQRGSAIYFQVEEFEAGAPKIFLCGLSTPFFGPDTDNATIAIQSGNVKKHMHPKTDEIQYIIEGSGAMWVGNERKEFKPGTLIVIPKGTAHAGTIVGSGPVKALAIKIPPQPPDDTVSLD